ncbi:MAG: metal-dependent transcriptional regulator [Bacteroidota bacterium]
MLQPTVTEENYLKAIYHLSSTGIRNVNTSSIASSMETTAASVTDMLRKLSEKEWINYEKYKGVKITRKGEKVALGIIRKHRLWEVFLTNILQFEWDEVHQMAEELEHVSSEELIKRLDQFLGHPKFDPHGDPIPDHLGKMEVHEKLTLSNGEIGDKYLITGVTDHSTLFLKHLRKYGLLPGVTVSIADIMEYDKSMLVKVNKEKFHLSIEVSKNILIKKHGIVK